jgi:hypothetical protein
MPENKKTVESFIATVRQIQSLVQAGFIDDLDPLPPRFCLLDIWALQFPNNIDNNNNNSNSNQHRQ